MDAVCGATCSDSLTSSGSEQGSPGVRCSPGDSGVEEDTCGSSLAGCAFESSEAIMTTAASEPGAHGTRVDSSNRGVGGQAEILPLTDKDSIRLTAAESDAEAHTLSSASHDGEGHGQPVQPGSSAASVNSNGQKSSWADAEHASSREQADAGRTEEDIDTADHLHQHSAFPCDGVQDGSNSSPPAEQAASAGDKAAQMEPDLGSHIADGGESQQHLAAPYNEEAKLEASAASTGDSVLQDTEDPASLAEGNTTSNDMQDDGLEEGALDDTRVKAAPASSEAGSGAELEDDEFADFTEAPMSFPRLLQEQGCRDAAGQDPCSPVTHTNSEEGGGGDKDDFGDFGDFNEAAPEVAPNAEHAVNPSQHSPRPEETAPPDLLGLPPAEFLAAAAALLTCLAPLAVPAAQVASGTAPSLAALSAAYPSLQQGLAVGLVGADSAGSNSTAAGAAAPRPLNWRGSRSEARFLQRLGLDSVAGGEAIKAGQQASGFRKPLGGGGAAMGDANGGVGSAAGNGGMAGSTAQQEKQQQDTAAAINEVFAQEGSSSAGQPLGNPAAPAEVGVGEEVFSPFSPAHLEVPTAPPPAAAAGLACSTASVDPFAASAAFDNSAALAPALHPSPASLWESPAGNPTLAAVGAIDAVAGSPCAPGQVGSQEGRHAHPDQVAVHGALPDLLGGSNWNTSSAGPLPELVEQGAAAWDGGDPFLAGAPSGHSDLLGGTGWGGAVLAGQLEQISAPAGVVDPKNSDTVTSEFAADWTATTNDDGWGEFGCAPTAASHGSGQGSQGAGKEVAAENLECTSVVCEQASQPPENLSKHPEGFAEGTDTDKLISEMPDLSFMFSLKE